MTAIITIIDKTSTVIMSTSDDNDDKGAQEDRRDIYDIPSEHPEPENITGIGPFHMVAEPCAWSPSRTMSRSDDINPSSTSPLVKPSLVASGPPV